MPYKMKGGTFRNIYTDHKFNMSLFGENQPSGNECLYWRTDIGAEDSSCYDTGRSSLCDTGFKKHSLRIRGLCSTSKIKKTYYATIAPNGSSLLWTDIQGYQYIRYDEALNCMQLKGISNLVGAQITVTDATKIIGKQEWIIYNDTGCSDEPSYVKNISFR